MAAVLAALRPEPHRGDQVAAGAVVLTAAIYVLEARFTNTWGAGIRFVIDALALFAVGALAVQAPVEGERPRAYQSVLYIATFFLALVTLVNLADILGADNPPSASGTVVWIGLLLVVLCVWFAVRRNSAVMTLLGAVTFAFVVEAFVDWVFDPNGATTFRWMLLLLVLSFALASLNQRGERPRHAVQFVNAAGLAAVVLGITFAIDLIFSGLGGLFGDAVEHHGAGTGWELFLLACGFGLIAYSAVDREPGPAYLGVLVVALFVGIAGEPGSGGASLIGWPIVLLLMAGGMLAVGLRPSHPLPPPPDAGGPPPPPPAPMPVAPQPAEPPTDQVSTDPPTKRLFSDDDPTEVHDR
jgi:hypothetical protein